MIDFSQPGRLTDNAFCESFNGAFRAECLDTNWFQMLAEQVESSGNGDENIMRLVLTGLSPTGRVLLFLVVVT